MRRLDQCTVEDSTIVAYNNNLTNLTDLNVALYMHKIQLFNSAHVKYVV